MDFPLDTSRDERCPPETPFLCGTRTPGRGLCVASPEECAIRTTDARSVPERPGNSARGAKYGYTSEHIGRGCYVPYSRLKMDYEQLNARHELVPAGVSLLNYNIWGLSRTPEQRHMFELRKPLLIDTLAGSGADMMCLQEMSSFSYSELAPYLDTWKYVSERPYTAAAENRNRSVDTFFVSRYVPRRVANYSLPGVLNYFNSMLVVEYTNLVIFNLYSQAGSRFSAGQEYKWIHYSRCRADILHMIFEMIRDLYREQNVIVCGDFNFHLDGRVEDWPELEGIDALKSLRFVDTYRVLKPADPGFTEDTDLNVLRWNQKLAEKHLRYDAILYRGTTWKPVDARLVGVETRLLSADDTEWFLANFSEARKEGREAELKGLVVDSAGRSQIAINASDHFGVLTTFRRAGMGGTRRVRSMKRRTRRRQQN